MTRRLQEITERNPQLKIAFTQVLEDFVAANQGFLADEADDFLDLYWQVTSQPEGARLMSMMLGVPDIEDWEEEFLEDIEDE